MTQCKPTVLLLKSNSGQDTEDSYEKVLVENHYLARSVAVLTFTFINSDIVYSCLKQPHEYSSIVISSPRAAQAIHLATENSAEEWTKLQVAWRQKPCFVVGSATAEAARRAGFCVKGENSGNADSLIPAILKDLKDDQRNVLFPCGNLKREVIPKALRENNIPMTSITVYETNADHSIKENLLKFIECQRLPHYIVFFSPSGLQFTYPVFQELEIDLHKIKLIAIGPSTEDAMKKKSLSVTAVCDKPSADSLLHTLNQLA